jgi:hypothetical protein
VYGFFADWLNAQVPDAADHNLAAAVSQLAGELIGSKPGSAGNSRPARNLSWWPQPA